VNAGLNVDWLIAQLMPLLQHDIGMLLLTTLRARTRDEMHDIVSYWVIVMTLIESQHHTT